MRRPLDRFHRRRLLGFGAAAAAVAVAPLLRPEPRRVAAQARGSLDGALSAGFGAVPAALAFGTIADVAAGWDGTMWAVDAQGAPSVYDSVAQEWVLHGTGIDAVAWVGVPARGVPAGGATPAAVVVPTVAPPPLGPATATALPTVIPPPLSPATATAAATAAPLTTATPAATVVPPPLVPQLAPIGSAADEGQVVRIALAGAPAEQVAPLATPIPGGTPTPVAPPLAPVTPAPTVAPPPLASSTPAGPATPGTVGTPVATATAGTATPAHTPTAAHTATATGTPGALGAAASGSFLFRGPEVLFLPRTALSGVAAAAAGAPAATPVPPVATVARAAPASPTPLAPATAPGAGTPAPTMAPPQRPAGVAVPLTPGVHQIGALWPDLPASFKLGVRGAADVDGVLYLFKAGRYVRADGLAPALNLAGIPGWPQTDAWRDGAVDLVGSGKGDGRVLLVRHGEYLEVDLAQPTAPRIAAGPAPLGAAFGGAFLAALQAPGGADAVLFGGAVAAHGGPWVFQGPAVAGFDRAGAGGAQQWRSYLAHHFAPAWPVTWNPVLAQAPSGRVGALWAATPSGAILHYDGAGWTQTPGAAHSVAAGTDGSAYCIGVDLAQHNLYRWDQGTLNWDTVVQHPAPLAQVSVGDTSRVWVRDAANAVHQLQAGTGGQGPRLAPVPRLGAAVHLAANADGTVWTCDGSRPAALRFISEATAPAEAVPAAGPVHKVASTGFGAAHVLVGQGAAAQLYRYDSPYVFKTSRPYPLDNSAIESGLGTLYLLILDGPSSGPGATSHVVALDAHTGREVSRSADSPVGTNYTDPVFDPVHEVVIVSLTQGGASAPAPRLLGLDARDLSRVRWTVTTEGGVAIAGRPTLQGTRLCFTDGTTTIAMYDTGAAPDGTPAHRWTHNLPTIASGEYRLPPPVLSGGQVYTAWWTHDTRNDQQRLYLVALDAATGALPPGGPAAGTPIDAATASGRTYWFDDLGIHPPVLAQVAEGNQTRSVLFVNGANTVWRVDVDAPNPALPYHLTGYQNEITSGFAYGAGGLWFGDTNGTFYGLDAQLRPLPHTPLPLGGPAPSAARILTTPVVYEGAPGGAAVFLGVYDPDGPPALLAYDPATGKTVATSTGRTSLTALSPAVVDGVLYAGGGPGGAGTGIVAQVLGIRVDEAVQDLRDFVAESQLMQDFDAGPGGAAPPANAQGAARYQTHLTVLDDSKAPRPNTPVKVWADRPTSILLNGRLVTVGPGDADCATAQAGADGLVTLVSGSVAGTGQDAADMAAAPLRVWAPFMDPYERLVVFPDQEFHNRLATAHAAPAGGPGADDPTRVNLQTAQSYGPPQRGGAPSGPPLFTAGDQQQNQPQQVAQAIQTMTSATGGAPHGAAAVAAAAGRLTGRGPGPAGAAWVRRTTDGPGKYLAYDDLPGARYGPVNTPAARPAAVLHPAGLRFAGGAAGATPPALTRLAPAEAAAAIDALQGVPWEQSGHAPPHVRAAAAAGAVRGPGVGLVVGAGVGSWWSDFWDWLKRTVAKITHFIVSVAEDIYVGIRVIVDGIATVFKQIVHALAEVAHAIGAFFLQLAKLIVNVIEALSVLFHFGEIVKAHTFLKDEVLRRINGVPGNAAYPGFAGMVTTTVRPKVDGAFKQAEAGVNDALNSLADKISGTTPVSALKGGGSSAHSAFTVTPGGGGAPTSTAVQGGWGMSKLQSGAGAGAPPGQRVAAGAGAPANPIAAFFETFATRIGDDQELAAQWQKVRSGFTSLAHSTGAGDFLRQGFAEVLRLLALLVDGALAVANAFVDGLLAEIAALVALLFDPATGLLTRPLEIPVLSWLYERLVGAPMSFLDVILLVVAIPVTVVWRLVKGEWPSQSLSGVSATGAGRGLGPGLLRDFVIFCSMFATFLTGGLNALIDLSGTEPSPTASKLAVVCSLVLSACTVPPAMTDAPTDFNWIDWGLALAAGSVNLMGAFTLEAGGAADKILSILGPFVLAVLSIGQLSMFILEFVQHIPERPVESAELGLAFFTVLGGWLNPLKLLGPPLPGVVALLDVVGAIAGLVILFIQAVAP